MLLLPSPMKVMIRHNIWTYFFYYSSFYFLEQECWNIAKLDSILATLAEETGETYAGVNSAYVYFGMWKATFSWHVEDMDVSGRFHRMFYDFFLHLIKSIWFLSSWNKLCSSLIVAKHPSTKWVAVGDIVVNYTCILSLSWELCSGHWLLQSRFEYRP